MKAVSCGPLARGLPLAVAASIAMAAGVSAQEEPAERRADRESCICFDREPGETLAGRMFMRANRARIGVVLGDAATVDSATGVRVEAVEPDGPAGAAGLEAGDVLTALNGAALGDDPGERLVRLTGDVEPGDTVTLTYYRDGERHTADVATDAASGFGVWSGDGGFEYRVAPNLEMNRIRVAPGQRSVVTPGERGVVTPGAFLRRMTQAGMSLVELNPALGEYFGTDEGVLVTDIDPDSELGLRPGDVILSINGRDVRDPAHVRAILDSYRPDEPVTLRVRRHDREREVMGTTGG